jgi:hypothetical protein
LDQIAVDVLSSVVLVVIIILYACSEPSGLSDTEHSTCQGVAIEKNRPA